MTHVHKLELETFVWGLYIVQPTHNEAEFAEAIKDLSPSLAEQYIKGYRELEKIKAACLTNGTANPWVIVIFSSDPAQLRRHTLHEVCHLAQRLISFSEETQVRFIEHVYFALTDTLAP